MANRQIFQLIGDLEPGGAENMVINLAKGLKASQYYNVGVCSREGGSLARNLDGIPIFTCPKKRLVDPNHLLKLCRLLRSQKVDLIHSHLFGNNIYGFMAASLTRKKSVLTIHGEDCFQSNKRLLFYRHVAPFVSKIVAVSMPLYKRLLEELRGGDKKVSLIPNGIDLSPVDGKSDFIRRKEQLGFPLNGPLVGAVGNIKPVKGYDVLIDAALHVIREEPGASILIIGGTYQYEDHFKELKALVRERNLQGKVYFLGKRNDVREILPLLDVYVLPSRSEGTSIALLEAMASKRAIVATKVGGTTEVIEDSRTGLLVPPDNPAALGKAIIQLLQNKSFAVTLGENARKRAEKEFSVGTMVERYLCLYNEILD